jgi:hypothetical protein
MDAMLSASGWNVQDRASINLGALAGVAVRDFQTGIGPPTTSSSSATT